MLVALVVATTARPLADTRWYVEAGGTGTGSSTSPFGRIQDAINVAQAGDEMLVRSRNVCRDVADRSQRGRITANYDPVDE